MAITDGLGGEELGQAGAQSSSTYLTGSITSDSVIQGDSLITDNNATLGVGSPYGKGIVVQFTARSNISGGTWVSMSGGLALAGPASVGAPIGVAEPGTDVASGGTVNVITHGIVPLVAEGTIAQGEPVRAGAGTALNTVVKAGNGSCLIFPALDAAGSERTVFIRL
jgi:hypothetical protein